MIDQFLHGRILGLPAWLVGIAVVGAGVGIYLIIKHRAGSSSGSGGGVLGQNTNAQPSDPNIDPNTGVPYAVEEATDPNTGMPVYMTLLSQGSGLTSAPTPAPQPGPIPPQPSTPGPIPPQPSVAAPGASATAGGQLQPNGGGGGGGAIPPQPSGGSGGGGGGGAIPPQPSGGRGPAGPPQPGILQAPGTPGQQGGRFRGTAAPVPAPIPPIAPPREPVPEAYAFQATDWWPFDWFAQPWKEIGPYGRLG